jgi:hypothetical protein
MVLARRHSRSLRRNTVHFFVLDLSTIAHHSPYAYRTTIMASSTAFNLSNGATNPLLRNTSDTQPETGSLPPEKPARVPGGSSVPSSSTQHSKGIFVPLVALPQVSSSNPYAEREFSMELYKRVSAHVVSFLESSS